MTNDATRKPYDVSDVVAGVELLNVYPLGFSADRVSAAQVTQFDYVLHPMAQQRERFLDYRYRLRSQLKDDDGELVADINYDLVATYVVDEQFEAGLSPELMHEFGATVALYAAFPYLREGVQSLAARLEIPNISLGMLKRGGPLPDGMSFGELDEDVE